MHKIKVFTTFIPRVYIYLSIYTGKDKTYHFSSHHKACQNNIERAMFSGCGIRTLPDDKEIAVAKEDENI